MSKQKGAEVEANGKIPTAIRLVDGKQLDGVVAKLREIERSAGIERTLAVGELVLHQFFGGNAKAWRDRRRNKNNSIRRLAERKDCPFCRSALNEAVGVYVAVVAMPNVRSYAHVSASHVACVLALSEGERQPMLEKAEREAWSVRDLRRRVVELRRAEGEHRGRPPTDDKTRAVKSLRRTLRQLSGVVEHLEAATLSRSAHAEIELSADELSALSARLLAITGSPPLGVRATSPSEIRLRKQSA